MRFFLSPQHDAAWNLAFEDHVFHHLEELVPDGLLFLYVDSPAIVVGRSQNVYQEVRWLAAQEAGLPIFRRISGGGAVYHDEGNLNFAFFCPADVAEVRHYEHLLAPVAGFLRELGLDAEIRDPSDIYAAEVKVSGNAQASGKNGLLQHGTLLFASDLAVLDRFLHHPPTGIRSAAVASRRGQVGNLRDLLAATGGLSKLRLSQDTADLGKTICGGEASLGEAICSGETAPDFALFQAALLGALRRDWQITEAFRPDAAFLDAVGDLAASRYRSFAWNYARQGNFTLSRRLPPALAPRLAGSSDCHMAVQNAVIQQADGLPPALAASLRNVRLARPELLQRLTQSGLAEDAASQLLTQLFD